MIIFVTFFISIQESQQLLEKQAFSAVYPTHFSRLKRDLITMVYPDSRSEFKKKEKKPNAMDVEQDDKIYEDVPLELWNKQFATPLYKFIQIV